MNRIDGLKPFFGQEGLRQSQYKTNDSLFSLIVCYVKNAWQKQLTEKMKLPNYLRSGYHIDKMCGHPKAAIMNVSIRKLANPTRKRSIVTQHHFSPCITKCQRQRTFIIVNKQLYKSNKQCKRSFLNISELFNSFCSLIRTGKSNWRFVILTWFVGEIVPNVTCGLK